MSRKIASAYRRFQPALAELVRDVQCHPVLLQRFGQPAMSAVEGAPEA